MTAHARPPLCAAHDPNPHKPGMIVPRGACDTHAHVFGPGDHYPFIPHGLYTPADALPIDYTHMLDALGMERGVLVQPSVYGTDNQAMLDAMAGQPRLRGIAVVLRLGNIRNYPIRRQRGLSRIHLDPVTSPQRPEPPLARPPVPQRWPPTSQ